jgi:flagellar biosynthesis/type III secretory pathway chaperone
MKCYNNECANNDEYYDYNCGIGESLHCEYFRSSSWQYEVLKSISENKNSLKKKLKYWINKKRQTRAEEYILHQYEGQIVALKNLQQKLIKEWSVIG